MQSSIFRRKRLAKFAFHTQHLLTIGGMKTFVQSLIDYGTQGLIVRIECHMTNSLPNIIVVGFANRAIDEARERVRGAFASTGLKMPRKRIIVNLAPADIPKDSSSFDLPIAAAILLNTPSLADHPTASLRPLRRDEALMGELGLDGSVRPVRGIIGKILAGRRHDITTFYIPLGNLEQARLIPDVTLVPLANLSDLVGILSADDSAEALITDLPVTNTLHEVAHAADTWTLNTVHFADIIGQVQAKRGLEIAAAGGHNILLSGPPGTGKSMLSRALQSILPPLSVEEMLETTHLHSLASKTYDKIIHERPFRSPHHTASQAAIIGGGTLQRPGEISLAHRGVLFLDELPEFSRTTIEALRQPLEDHSITIARARDSVTYPAHFILAATANPCPCGYYGIGDGGKPCICGLAQVQLYRSKLSGPILDRIDLYSNVHQVDYANMLTTAAPTAIQQDTRVRRERVQQARNIQIGRYHSTDTLNSTMTNRDIARHAHINPEAKQVLTRAAKSLMLSARAYIRTVKVARTIADLDNSADITSHHITEALQFRWRA